MLFSFVREAWNDVERREWERQVVLHGAFCAMTQKQAILKLLRDGPKTTNDLIQAPYGLAAEFRRAISELRKDGFRIEYEHGPGGSGVYRLLPQENLFQVSGAVPEAKAERRGREGQVGWNRRI